MKRAKKIDLYQIVEDFTDKLLSGEKITPDEVLKQYPKVADKLKPLLESTMMLLSAGEKFRAQTEKELQAFDQELWSTLEQKILAKNVKTVQKHFAQIKRKRAVPLRKRFEYILLLLYVKGYACRIGEGIKGVTRIIKALFLLEKETALCKLVKTYYDFVPYKIGPFDPAIYQDLQVLEMAGLVKKTSYKYKKPAAKEQLIDEGFGLPPETSESTIWTLTEYGMEYAKALARFCQQKDPELLEQLRRIKTKYAGAPLKTLLKYIYEKYPEYTKESEVLAEILK